MTETPSLRIFSLTLPHAEPVEARGKPPTRVPREGGGPEPLGSARWLALIWIPAFAGNAAVRPHNTNRYILVKPLSRFELAFAMENGRVGAADLRRDHVRP